MNINNLQGRSVSPQGVRANGTERATGDDAARAADAAAPVSPSDRVELSASARESKPAATPELAFAQKALENIPPLSQERVAEILQRITQDYYNTPEVARQIAERVATNISADIFEG